MPWSLSRRVGRAVGDRFGQPGVRDLLARCPTPSALRRAGKVRVRKLVARRSPRIAGKVTEAVFDAVDAQSLTLPAENTWGEVIAELAGDLDLAGPALPRSGL